MNKESLNYAGVRGCRYDKCIHTLEYAPNGDYCSITCAIMDGYISAELPNKKRHDRKEKKYE